MEERSKSVIVRIERLKAVGNGVFDIVFDFANHQQMLNYMAQMEMQNKMTATMFELKNYRPKSRLRGGGYYQLNTMALQMCQNHFNRIKDSYLFYGTYDLSSFNDDNMPNLLESHRTIDKEVYDDTSNKAYQTLPQNLFANIDNDALHVKVRDVGEANWNELLIGDHIAVLYDIGAPSYDNVTQVQTKLNGRNQAILDSKPVLILSHWDMDHIHCLKAMSVDDMRKSFSAVVCVDKIRPLTSQRIYADLVAALPERVYCLPMIPKTGHSAGVSHIISQGVISLYQGENSSNKNYSGIQMIVKGGAKTCHFTGDCRLSQADDVYQIELQFGGMPNDNILIAPHHGAYLDPAFRTYSKHCVDVVVSAGSSGYGHPNPTMETYLQGLCSSYWRTDQRGEYNSGL